MKTERKHLISGITGVYFVAAELSSRGYIVTTTSRNARGIDIMAATPNMKKTFSIQVKANNPHGTHSFWLLNKDSKNLYSSDLFYVFVNLKQNQKPDFYVVKSSTVARNIDVSNRKNSSWHSFQRDSKYKDNWGILK